MNLLHPGHGNGAGLPHIELPKLAELPVGMPAPAEPSEPAPTYAKPERFTPMQAGTERTRELARKGAAARWAKARKVKALDLMGLRHAPKGELAAYLNYADELAEHEVQRLAECVGGGTCGAAPASMIQSGALALAASRFLFATSDGNAAKLATAAKLAESSRQHFLAAHTLCALEAKARPKGDAMAELNARLGLT